MHFFELRMKREKERATLTSLLRIELIRNKKWPGGRELASPSELPLPCKTVLFALANQQFRLENQMVPGGKHKKIFAVILGEAILPFFFFSLFSWFGYTLFSVHCSPNTSNFIYYIVPGYSFMSRTSFRANRAVCVNGKNPLSPGPLSGSYLCY